MKKTGYIIIMAGCWISAAAAEQNHIVAGILILAGTALIGGVLVWAGGMHERRTEIVAQNRDRLFRQWINL